MAMKLIKSAAICAEPIILLNCVKYVQIAWDARLPPLCREAITAALCKIVTQRNIKATAASKKRRPLKR
jgi:hypothetical protein